MKKLNLYLTEKLKINNSSKCNFNPDELENSKIMDRYKNKEYQDRLLYDSEEDENDEDLNSEFDDINDKYPGFFCMQWVPVSECDNFPKYLHDLKKDLYKITDKIISGNDLGYEVSIEHGRIDITCINSGSRAHYYIYALTEEGFNNVEQYWTNETENKDAFYNEKTYDIIF